jgi:3-oxoacyl-[acyl-carrier protein] reductase
MKRIVITGGGGGLGQALQERFHAEGWHVDAPGRHELDVIDPTAVAAYFRGRQVDLLVCAAGQVRDAPLLRQPEADRDAVLAVNFAGASRCAAAVLPGMLDRRRGHLVFISSHSALHPPAGQAAYATAKAALTGLAAALARSHGPAGIRVNTVLPGFMETPMTAHVTPQRRAEVLTDHALGRFTTPQQVAAFIHFLEEQLPHTSGQVFSLDSRAGVL